MYTYLYLNKISVYLFKGYYSSDSLLVILIVQVMSYINAIRDERPCCIVISQPFTKLSEQKKNNFCPGKAF